MTQTANPEIIDLWDRTLLDYGLAMKKQWELEDRMRAATDVEEETRLSRLWENQCELVFTLKSKVAIMAKHMALHRAQKEVDTAAH